MASISLPRVLHPRKTSLEIERENFEKNQQIVLKKAVNPQEAPVKQKHVRSAIIGTFHTQGMVTFWSIAIKLPAMDDRIVAWKLCHVVHKVLREGHPLCLVHSQRHRHDLDEIGKLWVHLRDDYGKMIRLYTTLLMTKLDFHRRNPRFPGHLGISREELNSIGGNDINNNYFELSVEMFDYLDAILDLQAAVFGSLNMARSNSMTSSGQCRLAPLIPCIQDASRLYDYCVRILIKLHYMLPSDTLKGHRERFYKQFRVLKQFYQNTSNLQYFKDLIAIPPLPESPPNFLIESDTRTYVTQEVVVPQEVDDEPAEGSLIDTTDAVDSTDNHSHNSASPSPAHQEAIAEKEFFRMQCEKLNMEISVLMAKNQKDVTKLKEKITALETGLAQKDSELVQERQMKEDLMNQAFSVAQSQDSEQKVKDEKFNKLKDIYVKLRDTHIDKLREVADTGKKLAAAEKKCSEAEQNKAELETKLQEAIERYEAVTQGSSQNNEELESLRKDKELFNMELEILKKSAMDACKEKENIFIEKNKLLKEKEELQTEIEKLSFKLMENEGRTENLKTSSAALLTSIVSSSVSASQEIVRSAVHEVDNPAAAALTCTPDYLSLLTRNCLACLQTATGMDYNNHVIVIVTSEQIAHVSAVFIMNGKACSNTSPDISLGEKMTESCKTLGEIVVQILQSVKDKENTEELVKEATGKLGEISKLSNELSMRLVGEKVENLADMLESEMASMDKAIEEAANRIQDMLTNSRTKDSGIKLEVNSKILDSCTTLMQAIRKLVQKSRLLQSEIVAQGRGTASAKDFYKRNHQWTDGFISAAKAVAVAAKFLLTAADKVVTSNGKLEQLVVAAQEISASTAQLVVASRVKADRHSQNLQQLTLASKEVTTATGGVVATTKDCGQLIDEAEELDTSQITLHQVKRLEMETQVRALELEKELEMQRLRLAALRRHHYQLADEGEAQ